MPRFLCYCPDYPNSLDRRLSVRPEHLVAAKADLESGLQSELDCGGYIVDASPSTDDAWA